MLLHAVDALPLDPQVAAQRNRARFEPKVHSCRWTVERDQTFARFAAEGAARCGLDAAQWEHMVWHGGLHLSKRRVDVAAPPATVEAGTQALAYWFEREPEAIPLGHHEILLDREGIVAVNKPSWLPMQPTRASVRYCLEALVRELCGSQEVHAAHRLDRGTSGVVLLTRTPQAARGIYRQFVARTVEKRYLAEVAPPPAEDHFQVTGYIVPTPHPAHACFTLAQEPREGARQSHTSFWVQTRGASSAHLRVIPHTGRTHQIRVHLAAHGTPIVGDNLYGTVPSGRLHLHASSLTFALPDSGQQVQVRAADPF